MERHGIDVSRWQGRIDWHKLREAGVEFAMIKAGEDTETEVNFYENIKGAKEAGINCGVYWFSNARSYDEAVAEADACLSVVSQYNLEYPVVCDFEYRSIRNNPLENDRKGLTDAIIGFLSTIEKGGYYSMLYTNTDFSDKYLEINRITEKFDIWFAGYSVDKPGMPCGIWQYSESGVLDGLDIDNLNNGTTKVDLDISYKDYPQIMKSLQINGY
ncbi:MAG: glycoside hydrolase family 25 protein [Sphaerochaetaceae bacterium]|nr:glycoside hydrolase family 25 protein [Sphaerochaetaceae bacterium]